MAKESPKTQIPSKSQGTQQLDLPVSRTINSRQLDEPRLLSTISGRKGLAKSAVPSLSFRSPSRSQIFHQPCQPLLRNYLGSQTTICHEGHSPVMQLGGSIFINCESRSQKSTRPSLIITSRRGRSYKTIKPASQIHPETRFYQSYSPALTRSSIAFHGVRQTSWWPSASPTRWPVNLKTRFQALQARAGSPTARHIRDLRSPE